MSALDGNYQNVIFYIFLPSDIVAESQGSSVPVLAQSFTMDSDATPPSAVRSSVYAS
jgi:hypothetical protein